METDSGDSDLDDFIPRDPVATAALARAITDSEDESPFTSRSQSPAHLGDPSTGHAPHATSRRKERKRSDPDDDDLLSSECAIPSFMEAEGEKTFLVVQ